jgi:NDP-sugar pyrophosphorylase family protein
MRAILLAGGRGTRMAPYTTVIPKPLLPVGEKPILEIVCRQLAAAGFTRITLSLGYMSDYFKAFLAQHVSLRRLIEIDYVEEEQPTGTAGSLASIGGLDGDFLVMNGDILTDLDYAALVRQHLASGAYLTIAGHRKPVKIDLGVLETDQTGAIVDYVEKPTLNYLVSMGIYVYRPEVLSFITPGEYLDFPSLVLKLLAEGKPVRIFSNDAMWLDLGRPEDLQRANEIYAQQESQFLRKAA